MNFYVTYNIWNVFPIWNYTYNTASLLISSLSKVKRYILYIKSDCLFMFHKPLECETQHD